MHIIFLIYFAKLELGKIFLAETDTSDQPLDEQTPTEYVVRVGGEDVTNGDKKYYEATISVLATPESTTPTYTLGDVNADGEIDSSDALAVLLYFGKGTEFTDAKGNSVPTEAGNVNRDDGIDSSDALAILLYFGKGTEF